MKNKRQLKKDLKSKKSCPGPIEIIGHMPNGKEEALENALMRIADKDKRSAEVLLIGRNNFDVDFLEGSSNFKLRRTTQGVDVKSRKYADLKIRYLTAHRSKGLEADHVIIINAENCVTGFPNKMADDPLLALVMTKSDHFANAEERRLFYVAMTRTKNRTYILTPDANKSIFVEELIKAFQIPYDIALLKTTGLAEIPCPKCFVGRLQERINEQNGTAFLGCSNYPVCDKTITDTRVAKKIVPCPACGSYMTLRKGKYGSFYGCTNYPTCQQTTKSN